MEDGACLVMVIAAALLSAHPNWIDGGWVLGSIVAAVAVVAQSFLSLQRKLAPDRHRASVMAATGVAGGSVLRRIE